MSNVASSNLHELIQSLTKPEKRYFKVFASRHVIGDENNYEKLFDAIAAQEVYDEAELLTKFKNEAFVNRFSISKNRLYNSILKSLDTYHANSSADAQIKRQIHAAEILYKKGLYNQSKRLFRSAKKQAEKHEKITSLIEISRFPTNVQVAEDSTFHIPQLIVGINSSRHYLIFRQNWFQFFFTKCFVLVFLKQLLFPPRDLY